MRTARVAAIVTLLWINALTGRTTRAAGDGGSGGGFTILAAAGVAPATFHVNALGVPLAVGTPLTARYEWDFGDPGSRYDQLPGWVAAHCYLRPGRYPITLTVTDEAGHRDTFSQTVTVAPDRRRAVYVAPDGSDANNGAAEAVPLRSAAAGFAHLAGGRAILMFKAGGTYPADTDLKVHGSDVVIGRYGPGPPPVLLQSRGRVGVGTVFLDPHCDGVTIQHVAFATPHAVANADSPADKVGIDAIVARGRNVAVRECSFRNLDDGVNANGDPVGLLVEGCDAPGPTDLRSYLVWGQGADHAYLGNRDGNSTREHCIRSAGLTRVLIYDNDLTNLDRSKVDPPDYSKGTIQIQRGSYAYIAHNRVRYGSIRSGPRGGGTEPKHTATDWFVADGNDLFDTEMEVRAGSHHILWRNNVVRRDDGNPCAEVSGPDPEGRVCGDVTFVHNTGIATTAAGFFLRTWGRPDGLALADNLFVAPHLRPGGNGAAAVYVATESLDGFTAVSHNVWPRPTTFDGGVRGVCVVDPSGTHPGGRYLSFDDWAATPPVDHDRFANVTVDDRGVPVPGSAAAGRYLGAAVDHDGHPRPTTGPVTAGAFEVGGG